MPYLSTMLRMRIEDEDGGIMGRLEDVVAIPGAKFPVVRGIMVQKGHGRGQRRLFIPWRDVMEWRSDRLIVRHDGEEEPGRGDIFLARDLLDKQIVDMQGYKIVRVSDIRIARSAGELRVMGADVGLLAVLRRLGLSRFSEALKSERSSIRKDRIVPWNLLSPVDPMPYDVRLMVPYREFLEIHPSDIADIIEQLDIDQRAKIFTLVDDPKAAEVLRHILPAVRTSVAEAMGEQRLSGLLEIMPPDEAADILGSLPREKAMALLSLMGIEEASVIMELLGYEPDTAGGQMTTEFITIPDSMRASDIIEYLREKGPDAETIYYIYVVDRDGHLSGVLSLRDLLRASPDERAANLMTRDVITVETDDDQEMVADRLNHYNLLALPVVDEDHVLKGIVTVDDAIDVILEETSEDYSQLSGVPFEEEGAPIKNALNPKRWAATMLTFLGGILGTVLFGLFRAEFAVAIALVYFVPLALRAAHDVSVWSLTAAVRDLRGGAVTPGEFRRVLSREYGYAIVAAVIIGVLGFSVGLIWTGIGATALAGGLGLFAGVALAGMLGFIVPVLTRRARLDPAVGPGRLLGVAVMAVSIISFLLVSGLLVGVWT